MTDPRTCAIVLPCYNPPENWASNVIEQYSLLSANINTPLSVVVVNDGSSAGVHTEDIERLKCEIPHFKYITYTDNKGKGYALRKGVEACNTDIVIYTDVDFPYTIKSILKVYKELLSDKYDLAIGIKNESYYSHVPATRRIISKWLRSMIKMLVNIPVSDTQCGLKGFNDKGKALFLNTTINRYLFDLEFIKSAYKKGLRCKSIEIELKDHISFTHMNYKVLVPEMINFMKISFKSGR